MKTYSTKKSNSPTKKTNIFKYYKNLKKKIDYTKKHIKDLEEDLKIAKSKNNIYAIDRIHTSLYNSNKDLNKLTQSYNKFMLKAISLVTTLGIALSITGNSYGVYKSNDNLNKSLNQSYTITQQQSINKDSDLSYESFKDDINTYIRLSKRDDLSKEEKEKLKHLRTKINSSPENITKLSLDILKQKIADSLGIEDYTKIKIKDDSTQIAAGAYSRESGTKTAISISVDGKTIASLEKFQNLSNGDIRTSSDTIPKDVLKVINKIVRAQSDSQDSSKAIKALKGATDLEKENISFENEKNIDSDNER